MLESKKSLKEYPPRSRIPRSRILHSRILHSRILHSRILYSRILRSRILRHSDCIIYNTKQKNKYLQSSFQKQPRKSNGLVNKVQCALDTY